MMKAGDRIPTRACKTDGTVYRSWTTTIESVTADSIVTISHAGESVFNIKGEDYPLVHHYRAYYWFDKFYNLLEVFHTDGSLYHIYLNIASPPTFENGIMSFKDHELDVSKIPPGPAHLVDEDEFAEAVLKYNYSQEFQEKMYAAAREALELAEHWKAKPCPFGEHNVVACLRKRIAFIGPGVMAEAMIAGLLNKKLADAKNIIASGPRGERGEELKKKYGIKITTDNAAAIHEADVVVLSVKPQRLTEVMKGLKGIRSDALVLSIIAGATIKKMSTGLKHKAIVRSMPNTPGQIGEGITVWAASKEVTAEQQEMTRAILGALGEEVFVEDESYLDMATALSGSGPAYVFLFTEALDRRRRPHGIPAPHCRAACLADHQRLRVLLRRRGASPCHLAESSHLPGRDVC
jgi:pyrroline-5-carboxylate reductase